MPDTANPADPAGAARIAAGGAGVLAVGLGAAEIDGLFAPPPRSCAFVRFAEVTQDLLALIAPDIVIAPLVGPDFDILDLADRLVAGGFGGRLHALTAPLPRPDAVRAEVAEHATGIAFDLLTVPRDET